MLIYIIFKICTPRRFCYYIQTSNGVHIYLYYTLLKNLFNPAPIKNPEGYFLFCLLIECMLYQNI